MSHPANIGRYTVLGILGQGAMGIVYRGRDENLDREVALKVMATGRGSDPESAARFLREAKAVARLQHPNIVTIYDFGEHEGAPFMAMELLEGVDLQRAIEGGLRPDPKVTLPIVLQVLAGLGHAHDNGVVHRDVKPSNIFLPRGRPAKVMDFGVARLAGSMTFVGGVVGTPNYMSPEQVSGTTLDGRSDLFSVGLILYELVTGERAFQADSVVSLLYKIAHEEPDPRLLPEGPAWARLRRVIDRALIKNPGGRYPDARVMAGDLMGALRDLGGSPDSGSASDRALLRTLAPRPHAAPTPAPPTPAPRPPLLEIPTATAEVQPAPAPAPPRGSPAPGGLLLGAGAGLFVVAAGVVAYLALRPRPVPPPSPAPSASASAGPVTTPTAPPPTAPSARPLAPFIPPPASKTPVPSGPNAEPSAEDLSSPTPAPPPGNARLERANELFEKGRYQSALAEARAVLAREPGNAEARALIEDTEVAIVVENRLKAAQAALRRGDRDAALAEVRAGLAANPSDARLMALFRELTQ